MRITSNYDILTFPTMTLGRSNISRLIVKQKVQGTTRFVGLNRIHELYTAESVLSNACIAYFSQYSTADELLMSLSINSCHVSYDINHGTNDRINTYVYIIITS